MTIKAAVFDMDGTLVDSLMFWDVLWSFLGETYLQDPDFTPRPEDDKQVRTLTFRDAMELIHRSYGIGESGEALLSHANRMLLDFYANRVQPKPGAVEFLRHLKESGVKMCIATATATELVSVAMEHCGLCEYFPKVFSCSDIGKGKDQPDIFLQAAAYLGEKPEETWLFEDSLTAIETAKTIGMPVVGIYDQYNFGQERIEALAEEYIAPGETLLKLLDR